MKKWNRARIYTSPIIEEILNSIPPVEREKTKNRMVIAARIDDYMMQAGLSKMELSRRLKKRPSEITRWLSGTHNFTTDTLTEIAFELKVTIADLHKSKAEFVKQKEKTVIQVIKYFQVTHPMTPLSNSTSEPSFSIAYDSQVLYSRKKHIFA